MISGSFSAFSMTTEYIDLETGIVNTNLPREIKVERTNQNPDGTTSIKRPKLVRGNKSYPFGSYADKSAGHLDWHLMIKTRPITKDRLKNHGFRN
jgi:hypothetical protein